MTDPVIGIEAANFILGSFGPSQDLQARLETMRESRDYLEGRGVGDWTPERVSRLLTAMDEIATVLGLFLELVEAAEAALMASGAHHDKETGRVRWNRRPGGKGGRPGHVVTDIIGWVWEAERRGYRAETGDRADSQALRERIRDRLQWALPHEPLDPLPKGDIERALRNYKRRRARRVSRGEIDEETGRPTAIGLRRLLDRKRNTSAS